MGKTMTGKPPFITSLLQTPISASLSEARDKMCVDDGLPPLKLSDLEFSRHLTAAVTQGESDIVHRLLQIPDHADVDRASRTPLICIAAANGYTDIIGLLIRHGADINRRTPEGSSALIYAADSGQLTTMSLLLNAGALMNLTNRQGETALARATRRGWTQGARQLLLHGTNPHPMPTDGHSLVVSPLHLARQLHQGQIEQEILARVLAMDDALLRMVQTTLPAQTSIEEPGHLKETKSLSLFPVQLISDAELHRFVLYFKTPPGYPSDQRASPLDDSHQSTGRVNSPSDEVILVYAVRVQLHEGVLSLWPSGPGFPGLAVSFNGTRQTCNRLPTPVDRPGLCITSVPLVIRSGGLNTLCLEMPTGGLATVGCNLLLVGAYRVRLDVVGLIQNSMLAPSEC